MSSEEADDDTANPTQGGEPVGGAFLTFATPAEPTQPPLEPIDSSPHDPQEAITNELRSQLNISKAQQSQTSGFPESSPPEKKRSLVSTRDASQMGRPSLMRSLLATDTEGPDSSSLPQTTKRDKRNKSSRKRTMNRA